ncbi:MAG: CapA family protein [Dorea sp.]|jgi:poly-gamma-glutamate capsule biosynthesis protein CapA/YwtB (metallophosphatase superfamily)|nr:CapA family protein [Dorea sp.]
MKKHSVKNTLLIILLTLSLCADISITALASENTSKSPQSAAKKETSASGPTTSITISAAGDCTLGIDSRYNHNFNNYYKKKGSNYFFQKVRPVFSRDDITIVNFEGTLTNSARRARKTFTFKGPKKYASILKKGSVEVVNLANNHSKDFGTSSLTDTQKTLKKNKIGYCYKSTINYKTVKGVKTAFLGFNALEQISKKQLKTVINQAKKNKAKIIIVSFHWGVERKYYPNSKQKSLGRYAIDCGASLVLGHHPHVLQGIEQYKGRYIVYSLGNFCFGGNSNPKDKDTMIFQQTFSVKNGKLQTKSDAKIIPCSLSSHKNTNDFQPRILSGSEKKRLIKKMNKLSKKLKVSISSNGSLKRSK